MNRLPLLCMLLASSMTGLVHADPVLDRMRDQLRQTITQMRQLEDENLSLKAKLATTVVAVPVAAAPKVNTAELSQLRSATRRESERAAALQTQLDQAAAQVQQLQQALAQVNNTARNQQASALALTAQVKAYSEKHTLCEDNNKQLVAISNELLGKYQQRSFWQALGNHEPVTALYRVKLENIVQDYQLKIAAATVLPLAAVPSAPVDMAP